MDHELKTNRLLLRRFQENELKKVFQGLSHPEVIKYYGVSFDSEEGTKEQMKWFRELEEQGTGFWWAICSDENEFLGAAGFNNWSKEHRKAEIGY